MSPLIKFFDTKEEEFRKVQNIDEEDPLEKYKDEIFLSQDTLANPDYKYKLNDNLDYNLYIHQKVIQKDCGQIMHILITIYHQDLPSVILHQVLTQNEKLIAYYSLESDLINANFSNYSEDLQYVHNLDLPSEVYEEVEQLKSTLLAELLEQQKKDDIPYEEFIHYEKYLGETLESPDEVFLEEDNYPRPVFIYIKSFLHEEKRIIFIVLAIKENHQKYKEISIPVLAFPTNDVDLYKTYSQGKIVSEIIKN